MPDASGTLPRTAHYVNAIVSWDNLFLGSLLEKNSQYLSMAIDQLTYPNGKSGFAAKFGDFLVRLFVFIPSQNRLR